MYKKLDVVKPPMSSNSFEQIMIELMPYLLYACILSNIDSVYLTLLCAFGNRYRRGVMY